MSRIQGITGVAGSVPSRPPIVAGTVAPQDVSSVGLAIGAGAENAGNLLKALGDEITESRRRVEVSRFDLEARDHVSRLQQQVALEPDPGRKLEIMDQGLKQFREQSLTGVKDSVARERMGIALDRISAPAMHSARVEATGATIDSERATTLESIGELQKRLAESGNAVERQEITNRIQDLISGSNRVFSRQEIVGMRQRVEAERGQHEVSASEMELNAMLDSAAASGASAEILADSVSIEMDHRIAHGADPERMRKTAARSIAEAAIRNESYAVLRSMQHIQVGETEGGKPLFLSDTQDGAEELQRARNRISENILSRDRAAHQRDKLVQEQIVGRVRQRALFDLLDGNRDKHEVLREVIAAAPELQAEIRAFADDIDSDNRFVEDDREVVADMLFKINTEPDRLQAQDIMSAILNRDMTLETARAISRDWRVSKDRMSDGRLSSRVVKDMHGRLHDGIKGSFMNFTQEKAIKANTASADFWDGMDAFVKLNPKATKGEVNAHARKLSREILEFYNPDQSIPLNPADALARDPADVDWRKTPIFQSERQLRTAITEFKQTGGASGDMAELIIHLGLNEQQANEFLERQAALIPRNTR